MNDDGNYQNNPLHGVGLQAMLVELVDHYGFEILFAYLNIKCFFSSPVLLSNEFYVFYLIWGTKQ